MKELSIGNKNPSKEKLLDYGFEKYKDSLVLNRLIMSDELCIELKHIQDNVFHLTVTDVATKEEYVLHNVPVAKGEYVGRVRFEIESLLSDVEDKCFDKNPFKENTVKRITEHIKNSYGSAPEFLWKSAPDCAVFRRGDTEKWFGVLMRVPLSKFGFDSNDLCEILNLHVSGEDIDSIVDKTRIFYAFHMNKRSWISVLLDENTDEEYVKVLIENSYALARKK